MKLKIYLYLLRRNISAFFIKIFVRFKFNFLIALILLLNLRKMKKIQTNNVKKKVIVFSKSGGIEDINYAYLSNNSQNNVAFYELSRGLLKEIFKYFIKDGEFRDYYTIDYSEKIKFRKNEYKKFIFKVFKNLNFLWKFDACISFNLFYYAENDLPELFQKLKKKFIVIHKESVNSLEESFINFEIYSKMNKKFFGDKVAVYSENEKQLLLDSNILQKDQVEVTGCSRTDYSYNLRDYTPYQNEIVYFMMTNMRHSNEMSSTGRLVDWSELIKKTNDYIKELAQKNPNLKIIFKGKKNVHTYDDFPKDLPDNCSYSNSNPGDKFLKNANIVIAFNSTIVFEAILANRNVIIPVFDIDEEIVKKYIYKSPSNVFTNTKKKFFDKVDEYVKIKYSQKTMTNEEKESVQFYLGNSDGKSGQRLRNLIDTNI